MMVFLAHGEVGPLDEIVVVVALVVFAGLMGASIYLSWKQEKARKAAEESTTAATDSMVSESKDHHRLE